MSTARRFNAKKALPLGRAFFVSICVWLGAHGGASSTVLFAAAQNGEMTIDEAVRLGEEFGIAVGEVDQDVQRELNLQKAEGVAVFEVIGNSRADYAGIKVRAVIKEIDKQEVRTLIDFGKALKRAMPECNFTVGTYEPADPGDPVGWGVNFHFVGCKRD